MASTIYDVLSGIERGRKHCIENAKIANLPATDDMSLFSIGDLFLQKNSREPIVPTTSWIRPTDWVDTEQLLKNAVERDGMFPAYILLLQADETSTTFIKSQNNDTSFAGDGYLTSDGAWITEDNTEHVWDVTQDIDCPNEDYKIRWVIVYTLTPDTILNPILNFVPCLECVILTKVNPRFGSPNYIYANTTIENLRTLNYHPNNYIRRVKVLPESPMISFGTNYAFNYCEHLKQLILPNIQQLTSFGASSSYSYYPSIEIIDAPNLKTLSNSSFMNMYCLQEANYPKLTTSVNQMFCNCRSLRKANLPNLNASTSINQLFSGCSTIEEIRLDSVESLGSQSFENCYNLRTLYVPLLTILDRATFNGCRSLRTLDLPSVQTIQGYSVFAGNDRLKEINIPSLRELKSATGGNGYVFNDLLSLKKLIIPSTLTTYSQMGDGFTTNYPGVFGTIKCLEWLEIPNGWSFTFTLALIDLSRENLLDIIRKLHDFSSSSTTRTIYLKARNTMKLTAEEIEIATNKGWVVV